MSEYLDCGCRLDSTGWAGDAHDYLCLAGLTLRDLHSWHAHLSSERRLKAIGFPATDDATLAAWARDPSAWSTP